MKGSAQKFLNKAIGNNVKTRIIDIEKSSANTAGIKTCNKRSMTSKKIKIRQIKCPNNIVNHGHRNVKRRIVITIDFKEFESAQRRLAGIKIIKIIEKKQIEDSKNSTFKTFCSLVA